MAKTNIKTVYRLKKKNMAIFFGFIACSIVFIFLILKVGFYIKDYFATKKMISKIADLEVVSNIVDDEKTSTIKPPSTLSKFDNYWNYVKQGLIDIDIVDLKKINVDAIGYVEVKGTDFSYPVVKGEDGYYKNHSFDRSQNDLGWIYLSNQNVLEELDTNNVIYGNKVLGDSLFASLDKVFKEEWYSDDDNFLIRYYTNNYSTLWQIVSVYKTNDSDHTKTAFESEKELQEFIDRSIKKSEVKFKAEALPSDKFLTLTTNSRGNNSVVLAKLIKIKTEN